MLGLGFRIDHHIVPCHLLAGISGDSSHHGGGGGLGDCFGLTNGLALIYIVQHIELLLNVSAGGLGQIGRDRRSSAIGVVTAIGMAFLEDKVVPDPVEAVDDLSAHRVNMQAVTVVVVDDEEIVHIAGGPSASASEADGRDGRAAAEPVGHVDIMDVLLDEVIAGEGDPVLP